MRKVYISTFLGIMALFLFLNCTENKSITIVSPAIQKLDVQGLPATPGDSITITAVAQSAPHTPLVVQFPQI